MEKKKFSTREFVEMALLTAIIVLLAFTPIGYIRMPGLEITLIVVPVTVGAVTLGPVAGTGRRVWAYKLYPVLWNESVWRGFAGHSAGIYVFCLRCVAYFDGLADRGCVSGYAKGKSDSQGVSASGKSDRAAA